MVVTCATLSREWLGRSLPYARLERGSRRAVGSLGLCESAGRI